MQRLLEEILRVAPSLRRSAVYIPRTTVASGVNPHNISFQFVGDFTLRQLQSLRHGHRELFESAARELGFNVSDVERPSAGVRQTMLEQFNSLVITPKGKPVYRIWVERPFTRPKVHILFDGVGKLSVRQRQRIVNLFKAVCSLQQP